MITLCQVETDASNGAVTQVLSQRHKDNNWFPVVFYPETLHSHELNYPIHDKKLLTVIRVLKIWRSELFGTRSTNRFLGHRPVEHFMTERVLNQRQANWAPILSKYNRIFTYCPGTENIVNSLSRKAAEFRILKERQEDQRTKILFRQVKNNEFITDNDHIIDQN